MDVLDRCYQPVRHRLTTVAALVVLATHTGLGWSPAVGQVVSPDHLVTGELDVQSEPGVALSGSSLVALWFTQSGVARTAWSWSSNGGSSWGQPAHIPLANINVDRTGSHPVICSDNQGNFFAAVAYNSGVLQARETIASYRGRIEGGNFIWEGPFWAAPLVPYNDYGPYDAIDIACSQDATSVFVAYSFALPSPSGPDYRINIVRSVDGGATWTPPLALSGPSSNGPDVELGPNGEVHVSWLDYASMTVKLRRSLDQGTTFGPAIDVAPILDNLGVPPPGSITPFSGRVVPTYPHARLDSDFPSLSVDRSQGPHRGTLYLTWSEHAAGLVAAATSTVDEVEPNNTESTAMPIAIGHEVFGFESSADFGEGDCDYFTFTAEAGTTLFIDGALTFAFPSNPSGTPVGASLQLLCGENPLALALVVPLRIQVESAGPLPPIIYTVPVSGRYYLSMGCAQYNSIGYWFRVRTLAPSPGQAARDHRDIVMVRSTDGGQTWSPKVRVNDSAPRFDDCLPRAVVDQNGTVHVAWYDRREDPGCGLDTHTRWTHSIDGGQTFATSQRLSSGSGPGYRIGDHLGMATSGNTLHVLWTDNRAGDEVNIYAATVSDLATGTLVSGLSAESADAGVRLSWDLQVQGRYVAFEIDRLEPVAAARIATVPAFGPGHYEAVDGDVRAGTPHRYALFGVTDTGVREQLAEAMVALPHYLTAMAWEGLPNPVVGTGHFTLMMPRAMTGEVAVYDVAGHRVRTLHRGPLASGTTTFEWTGQSDNGHQLPPGVFLLQARAGDQIASGRFIQIH